MNKKEFLKDICEVQIPILDELMHKEFMVIKEVWKTSDKIANKVLKEYFEMKYFNSRSSKDIKKLKKIGLY